MKQLVNADRNPAPAHPARGLAGFPDWTLCRIVLSPQTNGSGASLTQGLGANGRITSWFAVLLIAMLLVTSCGRSRTEDAAESQGADAPPATTVAAGTNEGVDTSATEQPSTTSAEPATPFTSEQTITSPTGLQYTEVVAGDGPAPEFGDVVVIHYTGTLEDGTVFDSSYNRNSPLQFTLGSGRVFPGWEEGVSMMSQGGQAVLVIPPHLAFGDQGAGNAIPPGATLIMDVELLEVRPGAPSEPTAVDPADYVETELGIKYIDLVEGEGPSPSPGQLVTVNYTGWLAEGGKFDSSLDAGEPFSFNVGMGQVIAGWDQGILTMKVGGVRQLVIPPELGYGEQGFGNVIPPNSTLIFEVELLALE